MSPKGKIAAVVLLGLFWVAGAGCSANRDDKIDMGYYAGGRPAPVRALPPRPTPHRTYRQMNPRVTQHAVPRRTTPRRTAYASSDWYPPGGIKQRWDTIVIHHSASPNATPQGMRAYHMKVRGWDELGYHFVIGNGVNYPDGKVFVGARWKEQMHGAHCKTPSNHFNDHGIGICLIGNFQTGHPSQKQLDSLARLVSFLMQQCHIPESHIRTHGGITHRTECPGRNFSMTALLDRINNGPRLTSSAR